MNISYIKVFNQLIDDFFRELIEIFPEQTKIQVQYSLFQTIIKMNIKKVCNEFMEKSIPYLEKIVLRDEEFFKGSDRPSFLNAIGFENIWTTDLSQVTKNAIWNYIKSFFVVGIKIVKMPEETLPLIEYIINS